MLFTSGCTSTNSELKDAVSSLDEFSKKYHDQMVEYIENDPVLTRRDKNTFFIKLQNYNESLEKIKEYFSKK